MKKELSVQTIDMIKDSATLITAHNEKITFKMNEILYRKYPHRINQCTKLAEALPTYALNIDNLHLLRPELEAISQRHAEAGVSMSHHIVVGQSFTIAMQDVLGEIATPEFIGAWKEAYIYILDAIAHTRK